MEGYRASTYGDAFADVYDDWYEGDLPSPDTVAGFLADRTAGPVVELGSGTGRLTAPLRARGIDVVGLDISLPMLGRARRRAPEVPVVAADMAETPIRAGGAGAVLIAFNTLFNLPSAAAQRRCLQQVAAVLGPGGILVVEAFVPGDVEPGHTDHVEVSRIDADVVVLRVSRTDGTAGTVSGHHVELRDGHPVRLRPWHLRFVDVAGLDRMAADAGMRLVERVADWDGTEFDDASTMHVSVYGS